LSNKQNNAQGEMQLVAEWLASLGPGFISRTHVKVGAATLLYNGVPLTPAQANMLGVWSDWADARVVTPTEVWIVEGKLVGTAAGYGQLLDYLDEYPSSADYAAFAPRAVVGILLCQAERPRTAALFARYGIRTVVFAPTFPLAASLQKLFPAAQVLAAGVGEPVPATPAIPQEIGVAS
jgi:hypothetical protein